MTDCIVHALIHFFLCLVLPDEHSSLTTQMQEIGGQVAKLQPEQIILIAQAGSHMYGLATPTSDVDFLVIYAEPSQV